MANLIYEIDGGDGNIYEVEAPEGTPDAALHNHVAGEIYAKNREAEKAAFTAAYLSSAPEPPEEDGFFATVGKGLVEGYGGTIETAGLGAATLLDEENELAARKIIQELGESAKFESADRDSITYLISSGLGSFGAILTPPALAAAAPFSATAAFLLGTGGAAAIGIGAGAGEASERARNAGATQEQRNTAALKGAGIGTLELLPLGKILRIPGVTNLAEKLGGEVVEGLFGRVRSAAATGGMEAGQEVAAGILQNLTEQGYNPEKDLLDSGLIDEAIAGGGAGFILQAVVDVATKGRTSATRGSGAAPAAPALEEGQEQGELFPPSSVTERTPDMARLADQLQAEETAGIEQERANIEREAAAQGIELTPEQVELELENRRRPPTTTDPRQGDLIDVAETAQLEEMIAADETAELAGREAELSDITEQIDSRRAASTAQRRAAILDSVLSESDTTSQVRTEQRFSEALAADGIVNTTTEQERQPVPEGQVAVFDVEGNQQNVELIDRSGSGATLVRTPAGEEILLGNDFTEQDPLSPDFEIDILEGTPTIASLSDQQLAAFAKRQRTRLKEFVAQGATNQSGFTDAQRFITATRAERKRRSPDAPPPPTIEEKEAITRRTYELSNARLPQENVQPDLPPAPTNVPTRRQARAEREAQRRSPPATPATPVAIIDGEVAAEAFNQEEITKAVKKGQTIEVGDTVDAVDLKGNLLLPKPEKVVRFLGEQNGVTYVQLEGGFGGYSTEQLKLVKKAEAEETVVEQPGDARTLEVDKLPRSSRAKKTPTKEAAAKEAAAKKTTEQRKAEGQKKELAARRARTAREATKVDENATFKVLVPPVTNDTAAKKKARSEFWQVLDNESSELYTGISRITEQTYIDDAALNKRSRYSLRKYLAADEVVGLDLPVDPSVRSAIAKGDMRGALEALAATSPSKRVAEIARKLGRKLGDTKVEVVNNLKNEEGISVAGLFDPKTNTIKIDAATGVNPHTMLHETTHALTSELIENASKSNPVIKQLEKLFNDVEGLIDTAYGLQRNEDGSPNLDEFVAEAFGNPEFQKKLSRINADGSPISALQRFLNTIGNFVRRMLGMQTKPVNSVLNETDRIIEGMLAPAPQYRNANELNLIGVDNAKKLFDWIGQTQKSFASARPPAFSKLVEKAFDFLVDSKVSTKVKETYLTLQSSRVLGQVVLSSGIGDVAVRLQESMQAMKGAAQASDEKVNAVIKQVLPWMIKNPKLAAALNRVIYDENYGATIFQVDPTKDESFYRKKDGSARTDNDGNDLLVVYKAQRDEWKAIGEEGRNAFKSMRKLYKDQNDKLRATLEANIKSLVENESSGTTTEKNKTIKDLTAVYTKLLEASDLDVYFPLTRSGNFSVTYEASETGLTKGIPPYTYRMFESKRDRDDEFKRLEGDPDYKEVRIYDKPLNYAEYKNAPDVSFVGETLTILENGKVDKKVQEDFLNLFFATLPETSLVQSMRRRKKTPGYDASAIVALRGKAFDIGRNIARLEKGIDIKDIQREINALPDDYSRISKVKIKDDLKNGKIDAAQAKIRLNILSVVERDNKSWVGKTADALLPPLGLIKDQMNKTAKFAVYGADYKNIEGFFKNANQVAFVYTIGFNVSSSVVNLTNVAMFAYPYMGAAYGYKAAGAAIKDGYRYTTLAKNDLMSFYDVDPQTDKYTVKKDLMLPDMKKGGLRRATTAEVKEIQDMAQLVQRAKDQGWLGESLVAEAMGLSEGTTGRRRTGSGLLGGAQQVLDATARLSGILFSAGERYTKQTLLVSQYSLILGKMRSADAKNPFYSIVLGENVDAKSMTDTARKELAAREAILQTELVNGGVMLETAPPIAKQHFGRTAGMYKGFGLNLYSTMFQTMKTALDSEQGVFKDSEVRKIAAKQIIGVHATGLAFAGMSGVPIYGAIAMLYDLMFTDDEDEDFDTLTRTYVGEGWYKGWFARLSGIDVASRIKLTDLLWEENKYRQDNSAEEDLFALAFGPAGSVAGRIGRGVSTIWEGGTWREIERGFENLFPPGIANAYASTFGRYRREGGMLNKMGDPIYDDITGGELAFKALGFQPTGYTFEQERNMITSGIGRSIGKRRSLLMKKHYIALRTLDSDEVKDSLDNILDFNKRHPRFPITIDSMLSSIKGRQATQQRTHNGVSYSPLVHTAMMELRSKWDE